MTYNKKSIEKNIHRTSSSPHSPNEKLSMQNPTTNPRRDEIEVLFVVCFSCRLCRCTILLRNEMCKENMLYIYVGKL
jgi:hypothetical protein